MRRACNAVALRAGSFAGRRTRAGWSAGDGFEIFGPEMAGQAAEEVLEGSEECFDKEESQPFADRFPDQVEGQIANDFFF